MLSNIEAHHHSKFFLTLTFWCFDLNVSLVSAVSFSSGSVHICRTEHSRSCLEVVRRMWSLLFALYRKVLFWVRVCLFYTRRTLLTWLRHMLLTSTHTQMTLSYICSVNARTWRRLSYDLKAAYQTWATDGGKQTQAECRQDRTSLGRFQIRFCCSCW